MRNSFLAAVLCAATAGAAPSPAGSGGCDFSVVSQAGRAEVIGGNEAAGRASVMVQRDSPLAILRADLTGVVMTAAEGAFTRSGRHVLEVKNVSDKIITNARLSVRVGFGPAGGVGSGVKLGRSLQPGEQARIEWTSGTGRGTHGSGEQPAVVALVEEVQFAGCTYHPSEAWPTRTSLQ